MYALHPDIVRASEMAAEHARARRALRSADQLITGCGTLPPSLPPAPVPPCRPHLLWHLPTCPPPVSCAGDGAAAYLPPPNVDA